MSMENNGWGSFSKKAELRFNWRTSSTVRAGVLTMPTPVWVYHFFQCLLLLLPSSLLYFSQKFYPPINVLHAWFHIGIFFLENCINDTSNGLRNQVVCKMELEDWLTHCLAVKRNSISCRCQAWKSLSQGDRPMAKTFTNIDLVKKS